MLSIGVMWLFKKPYLQVHATFGSRVRFALNFRSLLQARVLFLDPKFIGIFFPETQPYPDHNFTQALPETDNDVT